MVCLKTTRRRRTPQDAARRHRPPQNAYSYETPMCYRMFYMSMYELSLWTKEKFNENTKSRPQKCFSVFRRKMPQDVTNGHKTPICSMS